MKQQRITKRDKQYLGKMVVFSIILLFLANCNAYSHYIFLTGGTLAGQSLSGSEWSIDVLPNSPITGTVQSKVYGSRSGPTVIVPFGYTWTWGDRRTDIVTLSSNLPQTESDWNVPISLQAPSDVGTYYILFGCRGEYNMKQIFSSTNWAAGSPVWYDDNDYHDMPDDVLLFAHENGYAEWTLLASTGYKSSEPGVMPIKVNVVPEPATVFLLGLGALATFKRKLKPQKNGANTV